MISFKQFLEARAELPPSIKTHGKHMTFQEMLKGPCKQFFTQSQQNGLLFRGMNGYGEPQGHLTINDPDFDNMGFSYYKKMIRKDRKPMSTKPAIHYIIDEWFEEHMGMKARSEAVFCYGERGRMTAAEYGDTTIIVPIGKFIYCWSPEVKDLYDVIVEKFEDTENDKKLKKEFLGSDGKPDLELIDQVMGKLKYTMNNFDQACQGNSEIMVDADLGYYVIPYHGDVELAALKKAFVHA